MAIKPNPGSFVTRYSGLVPYNSLAGGLWIFPRNRAGQAILFAQMNPSGDSREVFMVTAAGLCRIFTTAGEATGAIEVPLNVWSHIGFSRIGNERTMYVNGVADASLSAALAYTKNAELVGGEWGAGTTADFDFAALKLWSSAVADFEAEMYGYEAAQMSDIHTITWFETISDTANRVPDGVAWAAEGTLATSVGSPAFLTTDPGDSGLLLRRRYAR